MAVESDEEMPTDEGNIRVDGIDRGRGFSAIMGSQGNEMIDGAENTDFHRLKD